MKEYANYLKAASIINIILGLISLDNSSFLLTAMYVGVGILLYYYSKLTLEEALQKRLILLGIAVLFLLPNFITSILIFLSLDKLNELKLKGYVGPPKKKKKEKAKLPIDPEIKKIDALLKLGVAMVFISGILFATTTWEIITNPIKAIVLILIGTLFLGLSSFSEKKLKLEKTTFMYWLLSMAFYLLTWVGIGYFGLIGTWFTYQGGGSDLVYTITFLLGTLLSFITYIKFKKENILYFIYTGIILSIYSFLSFFNVLDIVKIVVINILLFLGFIYSKDKTPLNNFSKLLILTLFLGIIYFIEQNPIAVVIASLINIISLFYIMNTNDDKDENIFILIANYILIVTSIFNLDMINYQATLVMIITAIETLLIKGKILSKNDSTDIANQLLFTIISFFILFSSYELKETCLLCDLYLIVNFISCIFFKNNKIFKSIQPIAVAFVVGAGALYITEHFFEVTFAGFSLILSVIYCFMNLLLKSKELKHEYFISLVYLTILGTIINLFQNDFLLSIVTLITPAYIFCYNYLYKDTDERTINYSYVYLLVSIYLSLVNNEIICDSIFINNIIVIWVYSVLLFFLRNEVTLSKLTNIILVIPMFNIVEYTSFSYEIKDVFTNILQLYVLYLILRYFCKTKASKDAVSIVGLLLILSQVMFETSLIIGIYVGIIGILITMIGYHKKEYNLLFPTGLVIIVFNIIIQLIDLWEKIPFWLYLLLGGLSIIGFVTYKETKKINKK